MVGMVRTRYREGYPLFVAAGLACLLLGRLLSGGPLRLVGRVQHAACHAADGVLHTPYRRGRRAPHALQALDFARPQALLLLLLIPAGIWLAGRSRAKRSRAWAELGRPGRLPRRARCGGSRPSRR